MTTQRDFSKIPLKRLFVVALAFFAVACSDRLTSPSKGRGVQIDSISPPTAAFGLYAPTTVCVYGVSLEGGTVYFDGAPVSTSSTGCGSIQFDAPMIRPGVYGVQVVTPTGT